MLISHEATAYWSTGLHAVNHTTEIRRRPCLPQSRREWAVHSSQNRIKLTKSDPPLVRFGSWCLFPLTIRGGFWRKQQVPSSQFMRMFGSWWMVALMGVTLGSSRFMERIRDFEC